MAIWRLMCDVWIGCLHFWRITHNYRIVFLCANFILLAFQWRTFVYVSWNAGENTRWIWWVPHVYSQKIRIFDKLSFKWSGRIQCEWFIFVNGQFIYMQFVPHPVTFWHSLPSNTTILHPSIETSHNLYCRIDWIFKASQYSSPIKGLWIVS